MFLEVRDMYYQAKDICKLLDISPETLRYYEKTGVISPKINEKNNYRYYDAWDINYLFEYIFYFLKMIIKL